MPHFEILRLNIKLCGNVLRNVALNLITVTLCNDVQYEFLSFLCWINR